MKLDFHGAVTYAFDGIFSWQMYGSAEAVDEMGKEYTVCRNLSSSRAAQISVFNRVGISDAMPMGDDLGKLTALDRCSTLQGI